MKLKLTVFFCGLALIVGFAVSAYLLPNPVMATLTEEASFSSPAAQQNYQNYGDLKNGVNYKGYAETLKLSDAKGKQIAQRSMGCSTGCSMGCSSGCSMGCSTGCSSGCSYGCSYGCSSGCRD